MSVQHTHIIPRLAIDVTTRQLTDQTALVHHHDDSTVTGSNLLGRHTVGYEAEAIIESYRQRWARMCRNGQGWQR